MTTQRNNYIIYYTEQREGDRAFCRPGSTEGGFALGDLRVIEVKRSIFEDNNRDADRLRARLQRENTLLINLMSSPGAGKTTTLKRTIAMLGEEMKIGVMEADIDGEVDARAIAEAGGKAIQIHTGGMCHLDADMTRQGLDALGSEAFDLVVLENVGNLVCPAEFDTGAMRNVMLLSVPEGDDKPLKYPLMFKNCQVALINKCDALAVFDDFDCERVKARILDRNPDCQVFFVSAKTGEGFGAWTDWLREALSRFRAGKLDAPVYYDA